MYLHTGWDKFARDLHLEPGCQLTFLYEGDGEMIVKVFDDTACRVHYPHTGESGSDTDNMTWYVVYKGKVPGVYNDWEECRRQVHRFSGNSYKGYTTRAEAEDRYARYLAGERTERRRNRMKTTFIGTVLVVTLALFYVMLV
ncbi:hypothetical protein QYE76_045854 [Lolium multiflorum]|uniref:Ribonuclease H n=1 Tax=Lolium multiflorum TaxID=4521 RepID=A0AAD8X062_LOLMU|nr:hypothetical protein QYE76_045854 [Lolium multiflorum]